MQLDLLGLLRTALQDRYEVKGEIGRGGMAMVCRARDLRHDRDVAIKILYPDLARAVGGERFLREISILAQLSHPNILPLLDSGSIDVVPGLGVPWYAMPFASGETLRARLQREGMLPIPVAVRYTQEICSALESAHGHGYIHRDIKPENILLLGDHAVLADFGIARALSVAGGSELSSTGIVVGTPAYMSPEQSVGSERLDARSDLYSLGIVLYEMLAGHPPFTGATPHAISARHQFEQPPPVRVVRPAVPEGIARVLESILTKIPGDRLSSAKELDRQLSTATTVAVVPPARLRALNTIGLSAAVIVIGLIGWFLGHGLLSRPALDASRYVVLPFQHRGGAAPSLLSGDRCEAFVSDALRHWTDLAVLSSMTIAGAIGGSDEPMTLDRALAIARRLGAGRLLWGEVSEVDDSVLVQGVLYDAARGIELGNQTARFPSHTPNLRVVVAKFAALTYALVLPGKPVPPITDEALGTRSLEAYIRYATGDSALNQWNIPLAREFYTAALNLDPGFPGANLRLAQVGEWLQEPPSSWRYFAERAVSGKLGQAERPLAAALVQLADLDYRGACDTYRTALEKDSLDFRSWFGLGECQSLDHAVLPDSASPSGFRFRSSYNSAAEAYLRAISLAPAIFRATRGMATGRLSRVMFGSKRLRAGQGLGADSTQTFQAYQGLERDTLFFIPYPTSRFTGPVPPDIPRSLRQANVHNRARLLDLTAAWTQEYPNSHSAWQHRSWELERNRILDREGGPSALASIRRARQLALESADSIELVVDNVRLYAKLARWREARLLADSALSRWSLPTGPVAIRLASLAALTGRLNKTEGLLTNAAQAWEFTSPLGVLSTPPARIAEPALGLYANAILGGPSDRYRALQRQVDEGVSTWIQPHQRLEYRHAMLDYPAAFAFPLNGLQPIHSDFATGMDRFDMEPQILITRHDSSAVRQILRDRLRDWQAVIEETTPAPENVFLSASLSVSLADTSMAVSFLDLLLEWLPSQSLDLLAYPQSPAFLARSLRLRSELTSDPRAARSADGFTELWTEADPQLTPFRKSPPTKKGGL